MFAAFKDVGTSPPSMNVWKISLNMNAKVVAKILSNRGGMLPGPGASERIKPLSSFFNSCYTNFKDRDIFTWTTSRLVEETSCSLLNTPWKEVFKAPALDLSPLMIVFPCTRSGKPRFPFWRHLIQDQKALGSYFRFSWKCLLMNACLALQRLLFILFLSFLSWYFEGWALSFW